MANDVLDLDAEIRQLKLDENFRGFAGFFILFPEEKKVREGVIKIAVDQHYNNTGTVTITLLVDTENKNICDPLYQIITKAAYGPLKIILKKTVSDIMVSEYSSTLSVWCMIDIDFFIKSFELGDNFIISKEIIPALMNTIPDLKIVEVQWFDKNPQKQDRDNFLNKLGEKFKNIFKN